MATNKPRITVTLEKHDYELLRRMAAHQGQSMSSVVVEVLGLVREPFERVVSMLDRLAAAKGQIRDGVLLAATQAEEAIAPLADQLSSQFDLFERAVMEASEAAERAAAATGAAAAPAVRSDAARNPRLVTRGSGHRPESPAKRKGAGKGAGAKARKGGQRRAV